MSYIFQRKIHAFQTNTAKGENIEKAESAELKNKQVKYHRFQFKERPEGETSAEPFFDDDPTPLEDVQQTAVFQVENESMNPSRATTSRGSVSKSEPAEAGEARQENVDERNRQRKFCKITFLRALLSICAGC